MKSVRKKMAGATGLHGAFSGKRGNPAAADALSEDWGADDVESSQLTSEALLEHLLIQDALLLDESSHSEPPAATARSPSATRSATPSAQTSPSLGRSSSTGRSQRSSKPGNVFRPLRKGASRLTGVRGLFSGKDPTTASGSSASSQVNDPNATTPVMGDIGFQQSMLRATLRREASRFDRTVSTGGTNLSENNGWCCSSSSGGGDDKGFCCCNGFVTALVQPLLPTATGALHRLSVKDIVPWAAIMVLGLSLSIDFLAQIWLKWRVNEGIELNSANIQGHAAIALLTAGLASFVYLGCWLLGLRLTCASCACCRTQVPLPHWHRALAAVPILGASVLASYAPWLLALITLCMVLPQYFLSAAFCLDRGSLGVPSMAAAVTSALVVILTPAHIIVMVSLRNDRRLGLGSGRSVSGGGRISSGGGRMSNGGTNRNSATNRSRESNGRSNSQNGQPSVSGVYLSRLFGVLAVSAAPLLLDLVQCLPLVAAYADNDGLPFWWFVGLLVAFLAPRCSLLGLKVLRQRFLPPIALDNNNDYRSRSNVLVRGTATDSVATATSVASSLVAVSEHDEEVGAGGSVSRGASSTASSSTLRRHAEREHSAALQLVETFEYSSLLAAWLRLGETEEEAEAFQQEAAALDPILWQAYRDHSGGCCYRGMKHTAAVAVCVCFPNTPALFLMLDNLAKQAAAGRRLTADGTSADGTTPDGNGLASSSRPGQRSQDRTQVLLGDADYFNATLYGVYLVFSYGSQLILAYAALQGTLGFTGSSLLGSNDPFNSGSSSSSSDGSSSDDDDVGASRVVLAVMCCAEAFLAVGLAISARCGLGTTLWSRVRVVFVNRASLWLSAAGRDRRVTATSTTRRRHITPL